MPKELVRFLIRISIIIFLFVFNGCAIYTHSSDVEKELSRDIREVDSYETKFFLYSGYIGEGRCLVIPLIPHWTKSIVQQSIYYKEAQIWRTSYEWTQKKQGKDFFVSPNKKIAFVQEFDEEKPSFILHFEPYRIVEIILPIEINRENYVYPLEFVQWSNDSSKIFVKTENFGVKIDGQYGEYRGTWEVDAFSGNVKKLTGGSLLETKKSCP